MTINHEDDIIGLSREFFYSLLCLIRVYHISHEENWLGSSLESGGYSNTCSRLNLISCKHPHLYASISQTLYHFLNLVLQPIFDPCYSKQLHILLEFLDTILYQPFSIIEISLGNLVLSAPVFVKFWAKQLLRDH